MHIHFYFEDEFHGIHKSKKNNVGFSGEKHWIIGMVGATSRNRSRLVGNLGNLDDWTAPNPVENVTHLVNPLVI
jgi:hypothetical protein